MIQDIKRPRRPLKDVIPDTKLSLRERLPRQDYQFVDETTNQPGKRRGLVFFTLLIIIIALVFTVLTLTRQATVVIVPQKREYAVNSRHHATESAASGGLIFQLIQIEGEENRAVESAGVERVEERASGIVTVTNNYSDAPQRLVANTRFAAKATGKIYRIKDPITVPGRGSIDVTVTADAAGPDYNTNSAEFTIPGFQSDPRYTAFVTKTKTPITGGFVGTRPVVPKTEALTAQTELRAKLAEKLLTEARGTIPANFILYNNSAFINFEETTPAIPSAGTKTVTLTEKGHFTGIIFEREKLNQSIIQAATASSSTESALLTNLDELEFTLLDQKNIGTPEGEINFHLKGTGQGVASVDTNKLKLALVGQEIVSNRSIFSAFPGIDRADTSIWPPWSKYFPKNPNRITIQLD